MTSGPGYHAHEVLVGPARAHAEEVLFRGYIEQQLAARFRSSVIWLVVPSTLFGLLMADLTARAGTLSPAISVHLVNNAAAMLFVAVPDQMSGLALYLTAFGFSDESAMRDWLVVDFAWMFVAWLAARLALRR